MWFIKNFSQTALCCIDHTCTKQKSWRADPTVTSVPALRSLVTWLCLPAHVNICVTLIYNMISKLEVFHYSKLLTHAGLTPQEAWTKSMTMWPDQILLAFVLYPKTSIRLCGKVVIFLLSYSGLHDKKWMLCCRLYIVRNVCGLVHCLHFTCYFMPFFIQTRHINKYFSNLAVYYTWVSQIVFCLLHVERWIFVTPWLPPRSCLQLISSLVVFSVTCFGKRLHF